MNSSCKRKKIKENKKEIKTKKVGIKPTKNLKQKPKEIGCVLPFKYEGLIYPERPKIN